jgi:hypothetical protein
MNENEWLASDDPRAMLDYLVEHSDVRKLRLFAVGCCRRFWSHLAQDKVSREVVEVGEQFAEGAAGLEALARAFHTVWSERVTDPVLRAVRGTARSAVQWMANDAATSACHEAFLLAGRVADAEAQERGMSTAKARVAERSAMDAERERQVASIRCLFGNPFRPVAVEASWLTSDVMALARGIDAEKAFDRMPILADALQDAGCTNEDVLNHLRHGTDHVRWCWALNLVLGRG